LPAKSQKQANLMHAALGGARFPKAQAIRASMTPSQIHDFTLGPTQAPALHPHRNLGKYLHSPKGRR
jgi:hypothetical protein